MNQDFKELLLAFNAEKVEYLIVGAHALAVYGYVRATKDLDVWIKPAEINARKVIAGLNSFGSPLGDVTHNDLMRAGTVFQIGIAPLRIDLLTSIDGVSFTEAWADRCSGWRSVPRAGRRSSGSGGRCRAGCRGYGQRPAGC